MKRTFCVTLIFSYLSHAMCFAQRADFRNDYEKMNLKGKVQSIREISYLGDIEGKPILSRIDSTKDNCLYLFQTDGNLKSTTNYLTSGKVHFVDVFKYDTRGIIIEKNTTNFNNGKVNKTVTEYDSLYFKLKETVTDNKGQISTQHLGKAIMKDSNNYTYTLTDYKFGGTDIYTVSYAPNGNLLYKVNEKPGSDYYIKIRYFYNSNNQLIRESVEKIDKKPFSHQEFEYDSKGNVTMLTEKIPDHVISYTYEYNRQGDWIKRVAVNRRANVKSGRQRDSQTVTIREIKYF